MKKKAAQKNISAWANKKGDSWDALRAKIAGTSSEDYSGSQAQRDKSILRFKNAKPFKPSGKKPISRPK